MPSARRFPPPWIVEEHNSACFIVKDATGQALAYFCFEEEFGRRSAAKLLTRDEAATLLMPPRAWVVQAAGPIEAGTATVSKQPPHRPEETRPPSVFH